MYSNDDHGWAELLPSREHKNDTCTGDHRVQWAIIGAGFTGLSCARQLATQHPDDEIILLDARSLAQGASGRTSGFVVAVSHFSGVTVTNVSGTFNPEHMSEYQRVNRINSAGLDTLRHIVKSNNLDCDWREDGFYHTAADTASIQESANFIKYLEKLDIDHSVLNQDQLYEELGTQWYQKGIHVHQGALVQPAQLVYGLANSLPKNVRLFENSTVHNLSSSSPFQISTDKANIIADKVIVATNYEAPKLGLSKNRILGSTLSGSFTRKMSTDELALLGSKKTWGVLSLHSGGATVRLTTDGRISIRNTAEFNAGNLLSTSQLFSRQSIHRSSFQNRFPELNHVPFEHSWSGVEGISKNGTTFFQNPKPGLYLAGGYNGSGVSRGTAFGLAMADFASGHQSPLITDCLSSPSAQWLPPRPILDIGAWFTVRNRFKGVGKDR